MRTCTRRRGALFAIGAIPLLSGCAVTYVDRLGNQHVLGFAKVKLSPPAEEAAGQTVDVATFGVLVFVSPIESGVSLGYARQKTVALGNDVLVIQDGSNEGQRLAADRRLEGEAL